MTINPWDWRAFRFQRKPQISGPFLGSLPLRLPLFYAMACGWTSHEIAGELHFMVILVVLCLSHISHHHSHILLMNSPCLALPPPTASAELLRVRRLSPRATQSSRSSAVTPPSASAPATKARLSPEGSP